MKHDQSNIYIYIYSKLQHRLSISILLQEWLTTEQKIREETVLAEQARDLQNANAKQRQELAREHEAGVAQLQHRHHQEVLDLQNRCASGGGMRRAS